MTPLLRTAPRIARYTFALQWPGVFLTGLTWGVVGLTTFAAKRSLGGAEWTVPALIAVGQMTWIVAPSITPPLARANPQRAWRWLGLLSNGPLLLIAFVVVRPVGAQGQGEGWLALFFLAIFLHYAGSVGYVPHRGALLATNYPPAVRGRMYGLMQFIAFLGVVLASKGAGALLDHDPRWLRLIYPVAAVLGFAGFWVQSRIRWRGQGRRAIRADAIGGWARLKEGWTATVRILREDRAFRIYETAFMLYGIGFLMSVTLLVLYAEDDLGLSYSEYTWAVGVAYPLALLVGTSLWGRLVDRIGMVRTTRFAFLGLGLFFALMPLVGTAGALIAGFALWGLAMAGIDVTWSLGPLHFAPSDKAHMYPAVHFSLVGVRSVFAPFLGYATMELFGFRMAFLITAAFMVAASVVVSRSERVS